MEHAISVAQPIVPAEPLISEKQLSEISMLAKEEGLKERHISKKPYRDILPILRITLTKEKLDVLRLKLWKRFEGVVQAIKSRYGDSLDDLLRKMVKELIEGKKSCPEEKIEPPTCLLALVETRVNDLTKGLKTQKYQQQSQTSSDQSVNIDAMPIEKIREELRSLGGEIEPFHNKIAEILGLHKLYTKELIRQILTTFVIPRQTTASSISKQEHTFFTKEGRIIVQYRWKKQHTGKSAYIHLSWKAYLKAKRELWIIFLDPETQGIRYEAKLGINRTGEITFTSNTLGFDPSSEKWAISLILQEPG